MNELALSASRENSNDDGKFILALAMVAPSMGTDAFGSLWLLDLRGQPDVWDGQHLFEAEHPDYGPNHYVMIAWHVSQHWIEIYGFGLTMISRASLTSIAIVIAVVAIWSSFAIPPSY